MLVIRIIVYNLSTSADEDRKGKKNNDKCSKAQKEIEGKRCYYILGRTSFKGKDYYLAWQIDEEGERLEDGKTIFYADCEEAVDFEDNENILYIDFLKDEKFANLLWEIFSEQLKE